MVIRGLIGWDGLEVYVSSAQPISAELRRVFGGEEASKQEGRLQFGVFLHNPLSPDVNSCQAFLLQQVFRLLGQDPFPMAQTAIKAAIRRGFEK